jgi:Na+/proline symporter
MLLMNWFVTIGGIAYNVIIIFAVYTWISYRRKKTGVEEDFVLSNRKLPWLAVAATQALTALGGGHINGLTSSLGTLAWRRFGTVSELA